MSSEVVRCRAQCEHRLRNLHSLVVVNAYFRCVPCGILVLLLLTEIDKFNQRAIILRIKFKQVVRTVI